MAPLLESIHAPLQNTCLVIEHTPLTPQILTKGSWPQQKHASLQRTLHPFQSLQGKVLFLLLVVFPRTVLRTRKRYLMAPSWRKKVLLWDPCSSMSLCPFSLWASHESHSLKTWAQGLLSLHPISPIRLPPTERSDVLCPQGSTTHHTDLPGPGILHPPCQLKFNHNLIYSPLPPTRDYEDTAQMEKRRWLTVPSGTRKWTTSTASISLQFT